MTPLDRGTLLRFVELAGERLSGDWVVLGGTVLPLLGARTRVTLDIDVAGPDDAGMDQVVALLQIAHDLGLPVETINQTGAFFLREIDGWRDELTVLHEGPGATIHVPTATLFVLSKVARLTESDLDDCIAMLRLARARREPIDTPRLHDAVAGQLAANPTPPRQSRLRALRRVLGARGADDD